MKIKICEVLDKIDDINAIIARTEDDETIEMLQEYRDSILMTVVDI